MKRIDRWQADDNSIWDTPEKAAERDALVAECNAFFASLNLKPEPKDDGCRFANGHGFIQQPAGSRDALWAFAKQHGWNRDADGPIGRLAHRAYKIDPYDREWGQPYFALNPGKGEAFEVVSR